MLLTLSEMHLDLGRLVISIGVAYGSDIEKVSEILMQIACQDPDVMQNPAPETRIADINKYLPEALPYYEKSSK